MRLSQSGFGLAAAVSGVQAPFTLPNCVDGKLASNKVCDASLPRAERAAALVQAMTIDEKLANLKNAAAGAPRIGLPEYEFWNEALHGVAPGHADDREPPTHPPFDTATQFPMPILMAAAFDDDLIRTVANSIGTEARAFGNGGFGGLDYWTPTINPYKDPRWGRGSETPGEDALRISRYAKAMVEGLEGDKEEKRIIATPKHFAANDLDKWNGLSRHTFNAEVDLQDLAEYYLYPFQGCMRDLKAGSIMTSYNAVNGVPASANTYLLQTVLRDHWKWTGAQNFIVSDCGAVADVAQSHGYRETNAEGFYECVKSGLDLACESARYKGVVESWEAGLLTEDMVDGALRRVYEGLIQTGYFSGAESAWAHLGWGDVNTEDAQALALRAAVDGIVLLKNDGTLPLGGREQGSSGSGSTALAMVGFWADKGEHLHGDYSGKAPFSHTPVWAAEKMGFAVHAAGGPTLEDDDADDHWTEAAVEAAEKSDYIIYFGGLSTEAAAEGRDRVAISWPQAQLTLLQRLAKLGKPLVVVQLGDQVDNTPLLEDDSGISAILWTSWPGQDGGTAVLRILTGEDAPAGRLPVTQYPAKYADEIPMSSMKLRPTSDYPGRTYRWYEDAVQPFGFGLHYTDFEVSFGSFPSTFSIQELVSACSSHEFPDTCAFTPLKIHVANTGSHKSDYAALAFVKGEFGPKPYPLKTLAAYSRLRGIGPGESKSAELTWSLGDLARHDEDGNTVLYPGEYVVVLDEPGKTELRFTLLGEPAVLDKWPALTPAGDVHDEPEADEHLANQEL